TLASAASCVARAMPMDTALPGHCAPNSASRLTELAAKGTDTEKDATAGTNSDCGESASARAAGLSSTELSRSPLESAQVTPSTHTRSDCRSGKARCTRTTYRPSCELCTYSSVSMCCNGSVVTADSSARRVCHSLQTPLVSACSTLRSCSSRRAEP